MRRVIGGLLAVGFALALVAPAFATADPKTEEDFRALIRAAWGPEKPEVLEHFLEIREGLLPTYTKYEMPIQQWALREAGTAPTIGPSLLAIFSLAKKVRDLGAERNMGYGDYQRLTYLVYGRWLRAVREGEPREFFLIRALRELEQGITRHLANNPPEEPEELEELETRLASVRHQIEFLRPFAFRNKQAVLDHIDPETRAWLEAHRERIEKLDFHFFDTAPPPRDR